MDSSREPGEYIALSYALFLGRHICMSSYIHTLRFLTPACEFLLCYVTYQSTQCHSVRNRALQVQKLKVWFLSFHIILISALDGGELSGSNSGRFTPGKLNYILINFLSYACTRCMSRAKTTGKIVAKVKIVPVHVMKAYRGSRSIAPLILNLGTRWWWVVSITPWTIYNREGTPVPNGIRCWVGLRAGLDVLGKRITVLPLTGFAHQIFKPVAQSLY
jgi:hypothetical protein